MRRHRSERHRKDSHIHKHRLDCIPKMAVTQACHTLRCNGRGGIIGETCGAGINGTSLGPNLVVLIGKMWRTNCSKDAIARMLRIFDARVCKTAVYNAPSTLPRHWSVRLSGYAQTQSMRQAPTKTRCACRAAAGTGWCGVA